MGLLFNAGTKTYRKIFARPLFYKWNRWLLLCSLKALGVNNFSDSGEDFFLKRAIQKRKNPLLIDVGANVGCWSKKALEINPTSIIHAFEPNPNSFKKLEPIAGLNAHLTAVGKQSGHSKIYFRQDQPTSPLASLSRDAIVKSCGQIEEVEVQVIKLDDFIKQHNINEVTLLKIDVEGYEYEVLKGSEESIKQGIIHTIQFEFNEMNVFSRYFFRDFQELLRGFTFFRLLPKGMIPIRNYDAYLKEIFAYQNIVAMRNR